MNIMMNYLKFIFSENVKYVIKVIILLYAKIVKINLL